jgi:hypothetical protein
MEPALRTSKLRHAIEGGASHRRIRELANAATAPLLWWSHWNRARRHPSQDLSTGRNGHAEPGGGVGITEEASLIRVPIRNTFHTGGKVRRALGRG